MILLSLLPSPSLLPFLLYFTVSHTFFLVVGVTVMSYNVLCDKYATRQMYGYCPTWALGWEYRRNILLKEIIDSSADIIALQVCLCSNESCSVLTSVLGMCVDVEESILSKVMPSSL